MWPKSAIMVDARGGSPVILANEVCEWRVPIFFDRSDVLTVITVSNTRFCYGFCRVVTVKSQQSYFTKVKKSEHIH